MTDNTKSGVNRRRFLSFAGAAGTAAIAGCSGSDPTETDSNGGMDDTETESPTESDGTATERPEPTTR